MGVLGAGEDSQALELPLGDGVLLKHAADSEAHSKLRLLLHESLVLSLLQTAGETRVSAVVLLLQLFAGEDSVLGVDDDDVIAAVNVRGVVGLELSAEKVSGESSGLDHGLACCVKDVPLALYGLLGYHSSRHIRPPYE